MLHWLAFFLIAEAAPEPRGPTEHVQVTGLQEADGSHTLAHEVIVDASNHDVWRAISTPEGWGTWAAPVARAIEGERNAIETSYTPSAAIGDATTIRQIFLAAIPERLSDQVSTAVSARR